MGQDNNSDNSYSTGYGGYGRYTGTGSSGSSGSNPPPDQYSGQSGQPGQPGQQSGFQQQTYGQQSQQDQQGQQYSQQTYADATYQPPSSAQGSSPYDPTSTGMQAKTEALVSYLLGWVTGIVFLVIERKNRFVRFNAAQSTIFFGATFILLALLHYIGAFLGGIFLIGFVLGPVFACASFVVGIPTLLIWLYLMMQSFRGKTVRLPIISGYADSLVNRLTPKAKRTV